MLGSTAPGPDTDYSATPPGVVDDSQADLYSGAFVTSYDIPVPPAAGGAGSYFVLRGVDFGSGAASLLLRY